ncbi:thyroid transcription factor 1-associated protein 26 homolog [Fundulus heteroclitus]|uniref:thyroid transcription factor 1-associated protein 26 homolog n=1 Tax=Fundulus heteroclitus TaxID=8078 RepID=UPI00165C6DBD|nr:thyroid transcription factor 1-associated protein 26 homolog [Fundulus heteroclitus]
MAPTDQRGKNNKAPFKDGDFRKERKAFGGVNEKKKKKWTPHNKVFEGSVKEGQGFAFQKKQKVKYEYNKLLRRERKKKPEAKAVYREEYPEHLKHLYLAEAEQLRNEAAANRMNRRKLRLQGQPKDEDEDEKDAGVADGNFTEGSEKLGSVSGNPEPTTTTSETESLPMSNRMRKKLQKKTSYQKTKEKFEEIQEKRRQKKEEYLKNKQQREEAIQRYKQKKIETFRLLSKKTKKGQPNLNVQIEYLLQKIQGTDK